MAKKIASDVAAAARTWATGRGRNAQLADEAVRESRAFTETEALGATPPLIDLVAADVPDLLAKLDGRTVRRFDGRTVVLHTAGARVVAARDELAAAAAERARAPEHRLPPAQPRACSA